MLPKNDITESHPFVYIVIGMDANEHTKIVSVCVSFDLASRILSNSVLDEEFYDIWIEKHEAI